MNNEYISEVEITATSIVASEISYTQMVTSIANERVSKFSTTESKKILNKTSKAIIIFLSILGFILSLFYLLPFGICKTDYSFGYTMLVLFTVIGYIIWNHEIIAKKFWDKFIPYIVPGLAEKTFRSARLEVPFIARYILRNNIQCVRVSNGKEQIAWTANISQEHYRCDHFLLLYKKKRLFPETIIFGQDIELEKHLIECGSIKLQ